MTKLIMIHDEFMSLVLRYTSNQSLADQLWKDVQSSYQQPDRYFHSLSHLEQMLTALIPCKTHIEDWDALAFSLIYHDAVYDVVTYVTDNNNEDKSADAAQSALQQIGFPHDRIERCRKHILATKKHDLSTDSDTNYLIDADLSVLGLPWPKYNAYRKNIRKEYDVYPDGIYHAGRQRVLRRFLSQQQVYKTDSFHQQFEQASRENMTRELEIISLV